MEGFVLAVVALAVFVLGIAIGSTAANSDWKDDCKAMGSHRAGDNAVYKCERAA